MTRRFERERERKKWDVVLDESKSCPLLEQSKTGNGMERGGGEEGRGNPVRRGNAIFSSFHEEPRFRVLLVTRPPRATLWIVQCLPLVSRIFTFHGDSVSVVWADRRGTDFDGWITDERATARPTDRAAIYLRKKRVENEGFVFSPLPESGGRHFGRRWSVFLRNLNFAPSWLPRSKRELRKRCYCVNKNVSNKCCRKNARR